MTKRKPAAPNPPKTCRWTYDAGIYMTACGNAFQFTTGTPKQNKFQFCPYCCRVLK